MVVLDVALIASAVGVMMGLAQALAVLFRLHSRMLRIEFEIEAIRATLEMIPKRSSDKT